MQNQMTDVGLFVPSTNVWDVAQLYQVDVKSPEFKELLVRLYQNVNNIALALNRKDSGIYDTNEFVNGQTYFPNPSLNSNTPVSPVYRQVYRQVINFGTLPNTATTAVAHNIPVNTGYSFTRIYGCATDPVALSFIPLPYSDPVLVNNIALFADATNVSITTGADYTAYTTTYVIVEYIKS